MAEYNDYPLEAVIAGAQKYIDAGYDVHQKFTCSACGSRQTMGEPNKFHAIGRCEECDALTDIVERGCNYLLCVRLRRT